MNIIKRAILSIVRKPGKSTLIFLLVFLLSVFLSLGISTRNGIELTEMNLRARFPAIATLIWDFRADDFGNPTVEMIEAVGELPYVRDYDFRSRSTLYSTLEWATPEIDITLIPEGMTEEEITAIQAGRRDQGGLVNQFHVMGINHPYLIDIQANLLSLGSGRFMSEEELDTGANVAMISSLFADANNLDVGSTMTLENILFDYDEILEYATPVGGVTFAFQYWHMEEFRVAHQLVEFEVIGIFEVERGFLYPDYFFESSSMTMLIPEVYNRIYIPSVKQMELVTYLMQYGQEFFFFDITEDDPLFIESLFLLHDPRDIDNFIYAAHEVLPEDWNINDTGDAFAPFISSMDSMLWISDLIFRGAFISTIAVLCLVFTLLLYERRQEIGIYRVLGEPSLKTIGQLLVEVTMISTIAMIIALFIGNLLANSVFREILRNELFNQEQENLNIFFDNIPFELFLFAPEPMSIEEMMVAYDPSLNASNTFLFFFIQLVSVLFSTCASIIYVMRLKLKDILL